MQKKNYDRKISILDWLTVFSILIMFSMVFVPQKIWEEEDEYKNNRRNRMTIISQAQEFFYELTGSYNDNINEVFLLVESAADSLIADSLFVGSNKKIYLNNKEYLVNLDKDFAIRVDTTFSYPEKVTNSVIDTIYTFGMRNQDTNEIDTLMINAVSMNKYKESEYFDNIYNVATKERLESDINYKRRKYHLADSLIYCPISKNNISKKFILEIDYTNEKEPKFKISSPITEQDFEWRYGIFKYNPGKKESIDGGVKSWAGN